MIASRWAALRSMGLMALALAFAVASGCGGAGGETVTGKLTAGGQPVNGGSLMFAPMGGSADAGGEPASAAVKSDGTFKTEKGVVAGKARVTYYPPPTETVSQEWDGKGPKPDAAKGAYDNMKPQPEEVEIKSGANDLTLELVPR